MMNNALELLGKQLKEQIAQTKQENEQKIAELKEQTSVLERKLELTSQQMTEQELISYIMDNGVKQKQYYDQEIRKL